MKEGQWERPWIWQLGRCLLAVLTAAALLTGLTAASEALEGSVECSNRQEGRMLVPVGRTVGIKLFAEGVMVVGLTDVETEQGARSPARELGLKSGDMITRINGQSVSSIEEVQDVLKDSGGRLELQIRRQDQSFTCSGEAALCRSGEEYKLGAWIRDSMAGIGTVTFYDPATGQFGALGHGINDVDTGLIMPLESGAVMPSSVTGLLPGEKGSPGALHGSFDLSRELGRLTNNTPCGIFGTLYSDCFPGERVPVARRDEVKTGAAIILANVEGEQTEEYEIEILRIYPHSSQESQSLMLRITDEDLLEKTGGILQGMGVIDNRDNTKKPENKGFSTVTLN
ncbi:MAG: PDZ domain-containing protein [Oscillospiraceae bacterium]|nr:PDZ domain-containing protein [Oscillospiraceae bacterium]